MFDIKVENESQNNKNNNKEENNSAEDSVFQPVPMKSTMYMITIAKHAEAEADKSNDDEN